MATSIHPFSEEEIMAYLDGELAIERAVAAAVHLKTCAECQLLVADLKRISLHMLDWQVEETTSGAPRAESSISMQRPRSWRSPWVWGMAGVAALVVAGAFISHKPPATKRATVALPALQEYTRLEPAPASDFGSDLLLASKRFGPKGFVAQEPANPSGPMIVRTAELALTTRDFAGVRQSLDRLMNSYRGYIAELQTNTPQGQGRSLNATLRVPATQLDVLLSALKTLGHVDSESQRGEDVTQRYVDIQARLANLRTTEQRLNEILRQRTGRLSDVLAVEQQVDRVRGEIDTTTAEQKVLSDQITFASVQLRVAEEYRAPLEGDHISVFTRLRNAAVDGYRTVVDGALAIVLFLLSTGPAILTLIAIGFYPMRWAWRKWARS